MIFNSYIIRFFIKNDDSIEDFLNSRNLPIYYKYSDDNIKFFYITRFGNNIIIIFSKYNDTIKYIFLNLHPRVQPPYITDTNYNQNYNNSSLIGYFNSSNQLFGINIEKLNLYVPNIDFQEALYYILNIYDTKSDLKILTSSFFYSGNKTTAMEILYPYLSNNKIPYEIYNKIINTSPFVLRQIEYRNIPYNNILINRYPEYYRISQTVTDKTYDQDTSVQYHIRYIELPHINIRGLENSIYLEYSNTYIVKYAYILDNIDILKHIINLQLFDQTTLNNLKKFYIINDLSFIYNLNISNIDFVETSEPPQHLDVINDLINKIFNDQISQKTDKTDTLIIDKEYLLKRSIKNVQNNIPGLNLLTNLIKDEQTKAFNNLYFLDFTNNNSYIKINDDIIFIPILTLIDINTNTNVTYYNIFLNSDMLFLSDDFNRYDIISIENPRNGDKIIINRILDNNIINLSELDLNISLYDSSRIFPTYSDNTYGNLLLYLEKNIDLFYYSNINLNNIRFNNGLKIKLNKNIILNTVDDVTVNISGVAINRNVNIQNSMNILNNMSNRLDRYLSEGSTWIRNLYNQNNLYEFPLPIIIFKNIIVNAPILSIESISTINSIFDYSNLYNKIFEDGIDIVTICDEIIDILKTFHPDKTNDINSLIYYKTIGNNIISNNASTNDVALIFSLKISNSSDVRPFIIYLGEKNLFIRESSIYIKYANTNLHYPRQGINNIISNNAERSLIISDLSTNIYNSTISSNPTYRIYTSSNNILPIKMIEFLNIDNINSIINKILISTNKVIDVTSRLTEPIVFDITNIQDIYKNGRYILEFEDLIVDNLDVTINISSIPTLFEYIDIIQIKIESNIAQLNKTVQYRFSLKYNDKENINISNIIFDLDKYTLLSNSYVLNSISPLIYNIKRNIFSNILDNKNIIIIPNINIFNDPIYDNIQIESMQIDNTTIDVDEIFILDIINNSLSLEKTNNILYMKNILNNENKYIRGYIDITNMESKLLISLYNSYDNNYYTYGKIFMEGRISNFKNDASTTWEDYFKIYRMLLDCTVLEVSSTKNVPINILVSLKIYNNKEDFINDENFDLISYNDIKLISLKSYDDFISSENTYYPKILNIIKKEDVYPEFGIPKDFIINLEFKIKTSDNTTVPISKVYFDIINITNDIEIGIIYTNDYNIMDNITNHINSNMFKQSQDNNEILNYINKYIINKYSATPNATEINFYMVIRIRPKYYGINFAGINLSSFIANERISQLIPYLYITEYGTIMSIFKNNGVINENSNIENTFKNILPEYVKNSNIYNYINKHLQPTKSFGSIQILNCTNSSKDISLRFNSNTSGKIILLDSTINYRVNPYEFKNIKLEEQINTNDYTDNQSGIIYFDVYNNSDNHLVDTIEIPIPSLDKYIYQISSLIDNLCLHGDTNGLKTIEFYNKNRYFSNNIMLNKYDYSLINNIYLNNNVPIMRNKIDLMIVSKISNEDYIRCSSYINEFDKKIQSGILYIPYNILNPNKTFITYKLKDKNEIRFSLSELKSKIISYLMKEYNIDVSSADISAEAQIFNNYINIFIPGYNFNKTHFMEIYFERSDIFEQKFYVNTNIYINILNPLNNYIKNLIIMENSLILDDIEYITIDIAKNIFSIENIIQHLFLGRDIETTRYLYNNMLNNVPNKNLEDIKSDLISIGSDIKIETVRLRNKQSRSEDELNNIYINNIYTVLDNKKIEYLTYINTPTDPEEALEYYIKYKDIYDRNNYYNTYTLELKHYNTNHLDIALVPIINDYLYNKIDNNIITMIKIDQNKMESNGDYFYLKNALKNDSIIEIESLYPKVRKIAFNINNRYYGPYYNSIIYCYEIGKDIAISESGIKIYPLKEFLDIETNNFSIRSSNKPRYIIVSKLNDINNVISVLGIYMTKLYHGSLTINDIDIYHNLPFQTSCQIKTFDNELYSGENRIIINKSVSKYLTGIEQIGSLYISGITNQTGEYQMIIKVNYSKINITYSEIIEMKIRIVKPESLDNEYIIVRHERLDSPILIDKNNLDQMIEGFKTFNKYKSYNWSHVRGLSGGGGFHYEDLIQLGESDNENTNLNSIKSIIEIYSE